MDIDKLRSETPGTENVIHFNNAGASLMPSKVMDAMTGYLSCELNYGGYETARQYRDELEEVYEHIADFINGQADEIALMENATAAWNMGFYSIDFIEGDRILTSVSEYASNYINYLRLQKEVDVSVEVIPNDPSGQTSVDSLTSMMDERVKLISITHIPTNSGLVNPVEKIGEIVQNYNCLYLVDACQSVGQYPVDVQQIGCDLLSATGRKYLRGPRGTGFLYAKKEKLEQLHPPFLDLHSAEWTAPDKYEIRDDARRFENWESNKAALLGLGAAVQYASAIGIESIWKRILFLAGRLRSELTGLPGVTVQDIGQTKGGIVTFSMDSTEPRDILQKLSESDINVSTSSRSSTLIDMQQRDLQEVVRASVHYYNTEDEIAQMINTLKALD